MFFLYQVLLLFVGPLYLLTRALRGKRLPGLRQRLGCYPKALEGRLRALRHPIWLHLVSVGEAMAAQPLVSQLQKKRPDLPWVITTVTPTGQEVAKKLIRHPQDELLYLPWDFSPIVRNSLQTIQPQLFISFETELWPVLFHHLKRRGIPILVVNGRISPGAYQRYLWVRFFLERTLACVDLFLTQSPQDARRFAALGAAKDRIVVTGNLKWDIASGGDGEKPKQADPFRSLLSLSPQEILWTAGSTHPGEEKTILETYRRVRERFPSVRLLIAPRHPERVAEVEQETLQAGFQPIRRSQLAETQTGITAQRRVVRHPIAAARYVSDTEVVVLDTLGELSSFYQASDLVFVGGSLVPHGGHNLIEPAAASRAILTGPSLHNFQAVAESLGRAGALAIVRSGEELQQKIERLIENPGERLALGRRALAAIEEHRGATERAVSLILQRYLR